MDLRDNLAIDVCVLEQQEAERVGTALGLARLYQGDGFSSSASVHPSRDATRPVRDVNQSLGSPLYRQ